MKSFSIVIVFLLTAFLTMNLYSCQNKGGSGGGGSKDTIPTTFTSAADAAKSGIDILKQIAANKNLKGTLSLTEEQINQLAVGNGLAVQEVSFNKLVNLSADSSNVAAALEPSKGMIYPLQVQGRVLATAAITGGGDKWKLSDAGQSGLNGLFEAKQAPGDTAQAGERTIVKVPSLGLNCVAVKTANGTLYIPDNALPGTRIVKGQAISEREFSREIIAYAKQFYEKNKQAIDAKKFVD